VKLTGTLGAAEGAAKAEENREKSSMSVKRTVSDREAMFLLMIDPSIGPMNYANFFYQQISCLYAQHLIISRFQHRCFCLLPILSLSNPLG
jgi:hypothetical protein